MTSPAARRRQPFPLRLPGLCIAGFCMLMSALSASATAAAAGAPVQTPVQAIRIGVIDSANPFAPPSQAWRKGFDLAQDELNAAGGVGGHPVEAITRTDDGDPDAATQNARDLVDAQQVMVLTGSMLSNVALAVGKVAASSKRVFMVGDAVSDALTLDKGNRYTFRLRPSTYMLASMLADAAARLPARRWAVVAPNYEYGQSAAATFKLALKERRPDVEFVSDQWPTLGKLKGAEVALAIQRAKPDAIFNATFGNDLLQLADAGQALGLFEHVKVVSLTMVPVVPTHGDTLSGWLVPGYPAKQLDTVEHLRFYNAYMEKYGAAPQLAAVYGYSTLMAIADGMRRAGTTDTERLIAALRGLRLETPFGATSLRALDQQGGMGVFVGTTGNRDGQELLRDWRYVDGAAYLPQEAYVRSRRPAAAMK